MAAQRAIGAGETSATTGYRPIHGLDAQRPAEGQELVVDPEPVRDPESAPQDRGSSRQRRIARYVGQPAPPAPAVQ